MKKIYFVLFVPILVIALAPTSGPGAGYTGSPLDGQDCSGCHLPGPATTVTSWISTDIPPIGYTPGDTYTITLSTPGETTSKMGFQITSETADAKTGMFMITNGTRTQLTNNFTVTHTAAGTDPIGTPNSWTMDWTAPASGTGSVTFYAAVNASNDNGNGTGDQIFVTSLDIAESNIGIAENLDRSVGNLYPNPATDIIHLKAPANAEINVYDNSGRKVISLVAVQAFQEIDISGLQQGIYFVKIGFDGQYATRSFIKR